MKTRRVYSTHDVEAAQHALQAARQHGVENDDLSLVARGDIELQQIPDDRKEARTLFGAGAFGQFGADEYHQQALRLGLGARGAQQVVKVLDLHG